MGLDMQLHASLSHKGSPYQMFLHNQRYYLMMHDEVFDAVGYYRMDKITNMQIIQEEAKPLKENAGFEKGIDYKQISTALPYMYNDKPIPVTIKCRNYMMDTISDWFGTNFVVRRVDDEHFTATITASEKAILYWILQYNYKIEVISPESLRQRVIYSLKTTLAKYEPQAESKAENTTEP